MIEAYAVQRRVAASRAPATAREQRPREFTREEVLLAIRAWVDLHGTPPTQADWEPSRARRLGQHWKAERFAAGRWPSTRMVRTHFGSLGDAIEAAGFRRPRRAGRKPHLGGPEEILRAIREWMRRYGDAPTQADWDPVRARALGQKWRVVRYHDGDWPSHASVRHHFGTLGAAVRAAGLPARTRARETHRRAQLRRELVREYARDVGAPGPELIADQLRAVAVARGGGDDEALGRALLELSGAALAWADELCGVQRPDVCPPG